MTTEQISLDPDELTLGELEEVERITGTPLANLFTQGITAKAATALVYVIKRRSEPSFTLDDARALKLGAIDLGESPDPTDAAS